MADALGSVRQIVDTNGNVTLAESYEPYGSVLSSNGTASSIFGYAGEQLDTTGLIYLRARYMNPRLGIFLARDPWSGDYFRPGTFNGFNYAGGNPIVIVDPSGRCYPPLEGLRQVEPVQCANLDLAILILINPNSNFVQRLGPSAYIVTWTGAHVAAVVGAGILAGEGVVVWGARFLGTAGAAKAAEFVSEHPNILSEVGSCIEDVWNGANQAIQQAIQSQPSPPPAFSENLEAGLRVLEEYEPGFAQLIRDGTITMQEGVMVGQAGGSTAPGGVIIVSPDPSFPGSTAAAIYEELYHTMQGPMQRFAAEIEAKGNVAEWILRNGIPFNSLDRDLSAYIKGDYQEFMNSILDSLKGFWDKMSDPGFLFGRFNPSDLKK